MVLIPVLLWAAPVFAVVWQASPEKAFAEARAAGKPVLIDFQAPWCYSCYYMEKHVLDGDAFQKAAGGVVLLKTDVDREDGRALKAKYGVTFLPTYVLADPKGRALGRIVGEQTEGDFARQLRALLAPAGAAEPLAAAVEALRARLAGGEYKEARRELSRLPLERRKALAERGDWRILSARLDLMAFVKGQASDRSVAFEGLKSLLELEKGCELAYDVENAQALLGASAPAERAGILASERRALEALVEARIFADAPRRCADFRSAIEALAAVYEGLADAPARTTLLKRAVSFLDRDGLRPGEDRNHDDNLRYFLEKAGDEERLGGHYAALIEAYPADYVYAYRWARHLAETGRKVEALSFIERASRLAYGANRLAVAKVRARLLSDLGRKDEAAKLLRREIKAGRAFPGEQRELSALLAELGR